ncbi:MAG: 30S ribosomal protein S20 [Proteobacteria bacterium]|jgi:small subunit ribosomal protein S20|nr:30S ribosomal protein S20 [Pseudomonadota bacterium]
MANTVQARKRARQSIVRRARNFSLRTEFRTAIKKVLKAVAGGDKTVAQATFRDAQSTIDKIARKGIFHKNKASRHKSRLSAKVKAMASA